jgi:hypothetical protein
MSYRKIQQETHLQRLNGEMYTPSRSRVFNLLANLQGRKDETDPIRQTDIARLCDVGKRTVIRAINELLEDGQLIVHMSYTWLDDLYVRAVNTYSIVKLSLVHLHEALARKKERDRLRAKKLAEVNRRKADLSDINGTLISDSESNRPKTAQESFAITQQLTMSLRSRGWIEG